MTGIRYFLVFLSKSMKSSAASMSLAEVDLPKEATSTWQPPFLNIPPMARNQNNRIQLWRKLYCVYRQTHIPVPFFGSTSKNLQIFCFGLNAYFFQSFKKTFFFTGFGGNNISYGSSKRPSCQTFFDHLVKIYFGSINILGAVIKILSINKNTNALILVFNNCHKINLVRPGRILIKMRTN